MDTRYCNAQADRLYDAALVPLNHKDLFEVLTLAGTWRGLARQESETAGTDLRSLNARTDAVLERLTAAQAQSAL